MSMRPFFLCVAVIAGFASPTFADVILCTFAGRDVTKGNIPATVRIERTGSTANVFDDFIAKFHKGPIPAKISRALGRKILYSWTLEENNSAGALVAHYSLWLDQTMGARFASEVLGYQPIYRAEGSCRPD